MQTPVEKDFVSQLAENPNILYNLGSHLDLITFCGAFNELLEFVLVKHLNLILSLIPTIFFLIATVSSSYEAYTAIVIGPKEMFEKIESCWKNALVTCFCMSLVTFGIMFLYIIFYGTITFLAVDWTIMLFGAITLSIPISYFFMAALWMVSLAVSVLEEGFGGFKAIGRAVELMNGKRLQASLMMVPFVIVSMVVYHLANGLTSYDLNRDAQLAIWILLTSGSDCLLKLFMFVLYTVFFHELKTNLNEKEVKYLFLPVSGGEA